MSTLWTPDGEFPVGRPAPPPPAAPAPPAGPPAGGAPPRPDGPPPGEGEQAQLEAEMAELQQRLASAPASVVVANHCFGLFELAALHLSLQPPKLEDAQLAIDALGALVDALGSRLGEEVEHQLASGLAQLRMAYVQIRAAPAPPAS